MEITTTVEEYNSTIERLVKLMNAPVISSEKRKELSKLLDKVDSYNGMDFFKVKGKK